jgi:hypothetical protein
VNWVVAAHWNTRICVVDDAAFVKGTNTFLLWGAMNLGKVMQNICEMGREANEIFFVKFVSYKCASLGKFEKAKLPFACEASHVFFAVH